VFCVPLSAKSKLPQKPPGRFFPLRAGEHKDADSFKYGQPTVGTTYFYWYDIDTKSNIINRNGQTYIERWLKVLQLNPEHRPWIAHVETWNEWHEETDVAHSREYGRSYIVLTGLFADMWRAKTNLRIGAGYAGANTVVWEPGRLKGLNLRQSSGDGVWKTKKFGDIEAVVSETNPHLSKSRYLYFNVDDAFAYELFSQTVSVSVTYRDTGCTSFRLEYDNANSKMGLFEVAFRAVADVSVGKTGKWKTADFTLLQCRFMNRCNGTDFRIVILGGDLALAVSKLKLVKAK